MDELIAATELGATAAIVYPTEQDLDECVSSLLRKEGYLANVTKSLAPVFTLDYQTTHPLALLLDNLGDDSVASATLALVDVPPSPYAKPAPSALSKVEDPRSEQHIAVETADDGHVQETPSCQAGFLTNSFKSGAVVIRKALVQVGLDALSRARKGPLLRPHHNHPATKVDVQKEGRGMVSTSSPPLYTASPARQNIVTATTLKDNDLHDLGAEIRPVIPATMTKTLRSDQFVKKEVQTEHVFVHRYGLQSATLRIVHRFYSFSPSKFMQDMAILVRDDSMTGKLAMVLMSTICGVGVGMFGALLFVVALKVRLFQTRHRGQHQESNSHQMTAQQQQQTHQQMMQHGYKRVIPPGMLDSFGVQTVLQTSTSTIMMTTTAAKMDMAAFTKIKLGYAESVIEMEEGLEDVVARENARRQRLRTRSGHLFANATESNADADAEVNEERDTDVGANATEWDGSFEGDEMDEVLDPSLAENTTLLLSQGVSETATMDMERITAAIMNATHRGSYRRASHSRPGPQVELNPTSMTTSFSSSLSLSLSSPLSAESSPDEKHRTCAVGEEEEDGGKEKKKLPFANANAQTMCSICLGEYEVGDQVRTLPCYHQFHMSCIDPWLLSIASLCPICKRDLLPGSP
ncbi:hypothetical protein BGZ54_001958 [Gamsiella multidivaricata]|nr:hypothetical protein BGZ54_001958 [Gamsiella multidivaricata]